MDAFDDIEQKVKNSRLMASRATDERILNRAMKAFRSTQEDTPAVTNSKGRKLHSLTKGLTIKIAAILLLGIGLASLLLPGKNGLVTESIAVADIQQAIARQSGVLVTGTRICTFPADGDVSEETYVYRTEKKACDAGYIDTTYESNGDPVLQVCYHFDSGTVTIVYHFLQQYYRFQAPENYRAQLSSLTLLGLIQQVFQSGNYTRIGPESIQKTQAIGFEVSDVNQRLDDIISPRWVRMFFFNFTESKIRLWINPEDQLPMYMRGDFQLQGSLFSDFTTMHLEDVSDHWQWDIGIAEEAFFPERPEGYQHIDIPGE